MVIVNALPPGAPVRVETSTDLITWKNQPMEANVALTLFNPKRLRFFRLAKEE